MNTLLLATVLSLAAAAEPPWPMLGLDGYRNYDLYKMRPGEQILHDSSFDKFNQKRVPYLCRRRDENGWCILGEVGHSPCQVASIWVQDEPDSISKAGGFRVQIDNNLAVNVPSGEGLFNGWVYDPFKYPFLNDYRLGMGGNVIKVPMPFNSSGRVTMQNSPRNYAINFRHIPDYIKFPAFDPDHRVADMGEDVIAAQTLFGVTDPKLTGKAENHVSGTISKSRPTLKLASTCGMITKLAIRVPSIRPTAFVDDDGYAIRVGRNANVTLALDKNNDMCKFSWRIDAGVGKQKVKVYVDDKVAGNITSGAYRPGTWADMTVSIPSSMTQGKDKIKVRLHCVSSEIDCNIFNVALHCKAKDGKWSSTKYVPGNDWTLMAAVDVGPSHKDIEWIRGRLDLEPVWSGRRKYAYDDVNHTTDSIPDLRLTLTFDGKETVSNVPLGQFFASGLAKGDVKSLLLNVDTMISNGAWTSYFPMPFAKSASITLKSGDGSSIAASVDATIQSCSDDGKQSKQPSTGEWGYFHTQYRRGQTVEGESWRILKTPGPGIACGVSQTVRSLDNSLDFLTGAEQIWVNMTTPITISQADIAGTGTDHFYGGGFNFVDGFADGRPQLTAFATSHSGLSTSVVDQFGNQGTSVSMHRLMIADSISFPENGIAFHIEHGDGNRAVAEYETCAYYYA
ncbi:hypothetical protein VHEMI01728 [[Torrubiella] hemipterigena]|uniref:Uncharacterized protein n=1 Tax=[Torrubiella] hemipterigena TaxID=1531966 RepID=A0A0A1SMP5_9HYPO|nr:hypothetical protein VHEMI01728 [[Torrubiella] hemipterigena]